MTQPGWFSFCADRKTTPASRSAEATRYFLDRSATPPCGDARRGKGDTMRVIRLAGLVTLALMTAPAFGQKPCESMTGLQLPHTTISSSTMVAEGPFSDTVAVTVPAHCEVNGITRPTKDSEIKFALWLPATGWNGKYTQIGNGG